MNLCEAIKQSQTASTCRIKRKDWYNQWLEISKIPECLVREVYEVCFDDSDENYINDDVYFLRVEDALADDWIVIT